MYSSTIASFLVLALVSVPVRAWFRVACPLPLVQERIDPIIQPGEAPSQHLHTIHGGNNFNQYATYATLRASTCTSCEVLEDLSAYWVPTLFFHDKMNNTYEMVPNGGLLVYYEFRGQDDKSNGGPGLKAFPPGFRMTSGNPVLRSKKYPEGQGSQAELAERAIQWSCLRYSAGSPDYDGHGFPHTDCEFGFNARIHMPACWDGKNVDSSDHRSHVAFLSALDNGECPSTHPVGLIKLFYEVTWNIHNFADRWNVNDPNSWPFVYSTGDPTGYGWHGDFYNGWDVTALQNAIDYCNNPHDATGSGDTAACSYLNVQSASTANNCKIRSAVNETITGSLEALPGCNPLQPGPADAVLYFDDHCPGH